MFSFKKHQINKSINQFINKIIMRCKLTARYIRVLLPTILSTSSFTTLTLPTKAVRSFHLISNFPSVLSRLITSASYLEADLSTTDSDMPPRSVSSNTMKPSLPYCYMSHQKVLDLSQLDEVLSKMKEQRQEAYDLSSKIKSALIVSRASMEQGALIDNQTQQDQRTLLTSLIKEGIEAEKANDCSSENKESPRLGNLGFVFSDYIRFLAYQHFLQTGTLLPPSSLEEHYNFSDEEYLSGVLGFVNNDLKRYAVGRATQRDAKSVILARDLVSSLLDHLMKYDFRNGNLRRKYDGVKYALKTCETILYELSVTGCEDALLEEQTLTEEPNAKRYKTNNDEKEVEFSILPTNEMESLRERMMQRDELREQLIKKCRDGQKAAKQAIYALHREDFNGASKLISQCENCILNDLRPIVTKEPQLRYGSFSNVLEEYAEAKLYQGWLVGCVNDGKTKEGNPRKDSPMGTVLLPTDFNTIALEPQDYIGGLCDLTGEIGRYAVKRATFRDLQNVKLCMETNMSILFALESLSTFPGNLGKKLDPLRRTVEKQERMLYELSLVQATGRKTTVAEAVDEDTSNV